MFDLERRLDQLMFSTVRCYGKLAHVSFALISSRSQIKDVWSGNEIFSPEKGVAYTMALRHRHAGKKSRLRKDDQRERDVPTGVLSIKSYLTPYWVGAAALGERDLHNSVAYHCACASSVLI